MVSIEVEPVQVTMPADDLDVILTFPHGRHRPGVLRAFIDGRTYRADVFNCREDSQKGEIGFKYANGARTVAFGNGLYGYSRILNDPRSNRQAANWQGFVEVKPTRQPHDKIPIFISPKYASRVMDLDAIHPQFRKFLESREERERIWKAGAAFHIVVPVPEPAPFIHPLLITTPDDHRRANRDEKLRINRNTASVFYWHDPDWDDIFEIVRTHNPFGIGGISSFNEHGEQPAYTLDEVIKFIAEKRRFPFDIIVQDPIGEAYDVCSSHPQFRVPLKSEPPVWVVLRHGSISIDRWLKEIDSPFDYDRKSAAVAPTAVRKWSVDEVPQAEMDERVLLVRDATIEDYQKRHPKITFLDRARKLVKAA